MKIYLERKKNFLTRPNSQNEGQKNKSKCFRTFFFPNDVKCKSEEGLKGRKNNFI